MQPKKRSRPVKAAPVNSTAIKSDSTIADKSAADRPSTGRRYWARTLIDRSPKPIPTYGSTDWLQLPLDDPRRIAGVVIAAESWAAGADTLEDDLRREIEALQLGFKAGEDADYQAKAAAHRDRFKHVVIGKYGGRRTDQIDTAAIREQLKAVS